jgi:mannose-6-phosphate isomerase
VPLPLPLSRDVPAVVYWVRRPTPTRPRPAAPEDPITHSADRSTPDEAPATPAPRLDLPPVSLPANYVPRFYRGGSHLGPFRNQPTGAYDGEDWVGSTTLAYGADAGLGVSRLADGRPLTEAIETDPEGYLGAAHLHAFGPSTELLVKLLDPGERLAVHYHPTRTFAREHLGCAHGKTEAWLILQTPEDGAVHLGFRHAVTERQVADWARDQDTDSLLAALNRFPVRPGDTVLVPAGVPHAVGRGLFLVELQEPTDWSLMLERADPGSDSASWHLGLGADIALSAIDRSAWDEQRLSGLRRAAPKSSSCGVEELLTPLADPFFRAQAVTDGAVLEPSFSILIGVQGYLRLTTQSGHQTRLAAGQSCLLPYAAGTCQVSGPGRAVRCLPPRPPEQPA